MPTKKKVSPRKTRTPRRAAKRGTAELSLENQQLQARIAELEQLAPSANADSRLPTRFTNEEIAKREADRKKRGVAREGPAISLGAEPWEKGIQQKGDQLAAGLEPFEVEDPMRACIDRHTPAGHRGRMLSDTTCRLKGLRGWEPVKDAKGNRVMVGNMFLGSMPEERAVRRKKFYDGKAREAIKKVRSRFDASERHADVHDLKTPGNELKISRRVVDTAPVQLD